MLISMLTSLCLMLGPVERQVSFAGAGEVPIELGATVLIPDAPVPMPGVVLVAGSGPTDRDGNSAIGIRPDTLKQLAEGLARHGIASIRYDKRGSGENRSKVRLDESFGQFVAFENYVADVGLAFELLAGQPEVNPARVSILGHSEGAMLALALTARDDSPAVASLILVAGSGRMLVDVVDEQLRGLLARTGATPEAMDAMSRELRRGVHEVVEQGRLSAKVPPPAGMLFPPRHERFLAGFFGTDSAALARESTLPVMVVQGDADAQISVERDAQALFDALKSRGKGQEQLLVLPGLSHNLKLVENNPPGFMGAIPDDATAEIARWINRR
jgi:alpha-beta hydrolase superfamily lysophospholipase